ncbi:RagB/SusD family nutrient uptake outer membrane protein [Sphingobacterium sp. SYP-B4668]|uniref:RagB/SusD family nutrient uptake outer membrane protein n=1 Tax=Sphingobacterium sp. SYP-B4668 TaxID=2996035 RepID=UPI0022DE8E42|nr:RagB/SusD family nutrient uptake outer membrane protein [Sphingobacterium sp. SYP-B4668]
MKKITLYALLILGVFTSCTKLDVVPPSAITPENFWKNEKDAWYGLNSCYADMKGFDILDELTTDNGHSHKPWEGTFELLQQNGINSASPYGEYSYVAIRTANDFLLNVDKCEMDEELRGRMKAEARFFRAFAYLDLTQYYGAVPLVIESIPYNAPNLKQNSKEEVQSFILSELNAVAELLPAKYKGGYLYEQGRITSSAAYALRARAALYFGNFPEAELSARKVMTTGNHSLFRLGSLSADQQKEGAEMDLYIDFDALNINRDKFIKGIFSYEELWHNENASPNNPEYVLTKEFMADVNNSDMQRYTYMIPMSLSSYWGFSSYEPMQDLIDAYWDVDGKTMRNTITVAERKQRYLELWNKTKGLDQHAYNAYCQSNALMTNAYMQEFKNRDSRLYASMMFPYKGWHGMPKGTVYYKWDPAAVNADGNESWTGFSYRKMVSINPYNRTDNADDYPVIRYAEVLLTFAEARLMNVGYDAEVQNALNDIRDRCGMPNVPSGLGKEQAIDFIRNERRIELAAEGHRFDDVRRYGNAYCAAHLNGPSTAPDGSVVVNKVWNERLLLMPFPVSAMDANPLLVQNKGY